MGQAMQHVARDIQPRPDLHPLDVGTIVPVPNRVIMCAAWIQVQQESLDVATLAG